MTTQHSQLPKDIVTVAIKSNGTDMPQGFELLSVDFIQEFNRISYAEIKLIDGDFAAQKFPTSDSDFFSPGNKVNITLNYDGQSGQQNGVFEGIIIKHSLQNTVAGCVLNVFMNDVAVKMTTQPKNNIFTQLTDSDLIAELITANAGVSKGTILATDATHDRLVQYQTTDWDMLLSRAEVNGLLVSAVNGTVSAVKPSFSSTALTVEMGKDMVYDFDLQADARNQYEAVTARSWDPTTQEIRESSAASDFSIKHGALKAAKLASALDSKNNTLVSITPLIAREAKAWADARMAKTRLSMLKGSITIAGRGGLNLGDGIELKGMGAKFSGKNIITGLRHHVSDGNWITTIQFGLSAEWFSSAVNLTATKAAGLLPGVNGLHTGIVKVAHGDPDNELRVQVIIPGIENEEKTLWARLATPNAGRDRGMFFWPEPGDEVILGFINDDPRFPVILGSVYGSKNAPKIPQTEENSEKGLITRSGMAVLFDDEKQTLSIKTSDNQSILIDDKNKIIEVNDLNGNKVKLSEDGIMMKSAKNVMIDAGADVEIKGKNIKIKGSKIELI